MEQKAQSAQAQDEQSLFSLVARALPRERERPPRQLSPLTLAYIGDTVYDLYVRSYLLLQSDGAVRELHRQAAALVNAGAQAAAYRRVEPLLTPEESDIFRRGRNSHLGTVPKHAQIADYRAATGLEALLGYLYLAHEDDRLALLMRVILQKEPV